MIWDIDFGDRDWHIWFAWHPVRLSFDQSHRMAWWEYLERKTDNVMGYKIHRYRQIRGAGTEGETR